LLTTWIYTSLGSDVAGNSRSGDSAGEPGKLGFGCHSAFEIADGSGNASSPPPGHLMPSGQAPHESADMASASTKARGSRFQRFFVTSAMRHDNMRTSDAPFSFTI